MVNRVTPDDGRGHTGDGIAQAGLVGAAGEPQLGRLRPRDVRSQVAKRRDDAIDAVGGGRRCGRQKCDAGNKPSGSN